LHQDIERIKTVNEFLEKTSTTTYITICVIGIGTLGGFLSRCISDLEEVTELCIIDYDIIEEKNLINSIYTYEDLGQYKVDALERIIKRENKNINITKINERYIESKTILPKKYDLVLDCRDFTYDRLKEISARLYITSRYLIIDCRKNVTYDTHTEGKYLSFLSKNDLRYASVEATMLIIKGGLKLLIENESVMSIELDHLDRKVHDDISKSKEVDIIYEPHQNEKRFVNLKEVFNLIIEYNKLNDLVICLGSKNDSNIDKLVQRSSLKSYQDVLQVLMPLVSLPYTHSSYLIKLQIVDNKYYIELLPDTGAA